jgi:hypothetical protein
VSDETAEPLSLILKGSIAQAKSQLVDTRNLRHYPHPMFNMTLYYCCCS